MRAADLQRQAIGLGILASVLVISAPAAAITIDAFTTAQTVVDAVGGAPTTGFVSGAGILGTERDMHVDAAGGIGATNLTLNASGGTLTYTQALLTSGIATLQWDGVDGSTGTPPQIPGLVSQDFTEGGNHNAIQIDITAAGGAADLTLTVFTTASDFSTRTVTLSGAVETLILPYSTFADSGSGADFADVEAFVLEIDGSAFTGQTVTMGPIMTVPEPSTLALLGLGLIGLATQGRRS